MLKWLMKMLNGAFPQDEPNQPIPPEDEYYPEGGVIHAPDESFELEPAAFGGDEGPICKLLVAVGSEVYGGEALAIIETSQYKLEIVSPCSGTIVEVFVSTSIQGEAIKARQPILRITPTNIEEFSKEVFVAP